MNNKFSHKLRIAMIEVFRAMAVAIAVMSTGCIVLDLAKKIDLSWRREKPETKSPDAIPAEKIIWLGRDVSGYKITEATTNAVYDFRARLVHYNGSPGIMRNWKQVKGSVGNPWI